MELAVCSGCGRHARPSESCPFCGTPIERPAARPLGRRLFTRAAIFGSAALVWGCGSPPEPEEADARDTTGAEAEPAHAETDAASDTESGHNAEGTETAAEATGEADATSRDSIVDEAAAEATTDDATSSDATADDATSGDASASDATSSDATSGDIATELERSPTDGSLGGPPQIPEWRRHRRPCIRRRVRENGRVRIVSVCPPYGAPPSETLV